MGGPPLSLARYLCPQLHFFGLGWGFERKSCVRRVWPGKGAPAAPFFGLGWALSRANRALSAFGPENVSA